MNIVTKFDIGDSVFFIEDNKVKTQYVESISIEISIDCWFNTLRLIKYTLDDGKSPSNEDKLFASKDELLKSL